MGWLRSRTKINQKKNSIVAPPKFRLRKCAALMILGGIVLTGCGRTADPNPVELTSTEKNLKAVGLAYREYHSRNRAFPTSLDQLKNWVKGQSADLRKKMGIDDVESSFKSPRDNQPFVLVAAPKSNDSRGMMPVIAYEKTGVGGRHFIVNDRGLTEELESSELQLKLRK